MNDTVALIDLGPWCSSDVLRQNICSPLSQRGFTWATDGRTLVRVPLREGVADRPSPGLETFCALLDRLPDSPRCDLPDLPEPVRAKCARCEGSGNYSRCPKCKGVGEIECYVCGHAEDCEECDGTGAVTGLVLKCEKCGGAGSIPEVVPVSVGLCWFGDWLLRRISQLPGVALYPRGPFEPAYFSFDGGVGLAMPMAVPRT